MDGSQSVIVGVDGSADAAIALHWGVEYGARHHLPVHAVSALVGHRCDDAGPPTGADAGVDLERVLEAELGPQHGVVALVSPAPAVATLEQLSRQAAIVVVGAGHLDHCGDHRRHHSVAREVARRASSPLAIVRDHPCAPDAPVVVGVDRSASSRQALQWAVDECAMSGRTVVAAHAWHIEPPTFGIVVTDDDAARMERLASGVLDDAIRSLDHAPDSVDIDARTVYGTAYGALLGAVPEPAMVVLGTRRLGPAKRLVLGSTAELVARDAGTVVVVVPPAPAA